MPCETRDRIIITTSILGVLLSSYALYVELKAEGNPGYKAFCDLHERAQCTRVLTSKYSKGFGLIDLKIPNPIIGIMYYCIMIYLTTYDGKGVVRLQYWISLLAVVSSVYLAGLLIFVLHDICVVCISTYFVNGALSFLVTRKKSELGYNDKRD